MTSSSKLVGTVLAGRYRIERQMGEGGMGAIFEATQLSLSRKVAIKVLKPAFENDEDRIKRFEVETEAIARLNHPHIVSVVDAGRAEGEVLFLAMELLDGVTVRQALRGGPLDWRRALTVTEGVASALVAAHAAGVIHRDLKAENVVLWSNAGSPDFAKVLDFGVAKLTSQAQAPVLTGSGFVAGTPGCISPEQILGKKDDPRSDLYSLGVLLFEMLTARPPFVAENTMELMLKHLNEPPPRPSDFANGREIPPALDALAHGLLAKDPELRPASAQALVTALRAMRESGTYATPQLELTPPNATTVGSRLVAVPEAELPTMSAVTTPTPMGVTITPGTSPATTRPSDGRSADDIANEIATQLVAKARAGFKRRMRRRLVVAGSLALALMASCGGFQMWQHKKSRALSHNDAAVEHLAKAIDATWELDLPRVMDETDLAEALDPTTPWSHLLRANAILLKQGSLQAVDHEVAEARRLAAEDARANRMVFQADHAAAFTDLVWSPGTTDPVARAEAHQAEYRCTDPIEGLLFALRMMSIGRADPAQIEPLFQRLPQDPLRPAVALGLARMARAHEHLDEARRLIEAQLAHSKSRVLVDELVDIELSDGNKQKAIDLLAAQSSSDRNDLRALARLGYLRARGEKGDWERFNAFVKELDSFSKGDPRRVEMLEIAGLELASLGHLEEANARWLDGFQEALAQDPEGAGEIASLAVFFALMLGDDVLARTWLARAKDATFHMENAGTKALNTFFALAASVLLAATPEDRARAQRDLNILKRDVNDVPVVVPMVVIQTALWAHDWTLAEQVARTVPECMVPTKLARIAYERALAADAAHAQAELINARDRLLEATSAKEEQRCTRGADVAGWLQGLSFGTALISLADTNRRLNDAQGAAAALAHSAAFWSPDPELPAAREAATVAAWLNASTPQKTVTPPK